MVWIRNDIYNVVWELITHPCIQKWLSKSELVKETHIDHIETIHNVPLSGTQAILWEAATHSAHGTLSDRQTAWLWTNYVWIKCHTTSGSVLKGWGTMGSNIIQWYLKLEEQTLYMILIELPLNAFAMPTILRLICKIYFVHYICSKN